MGIIQLDDFSQERFSRFFLDRISRRRRGFVGAVPIGDKPFAISSSVTELFLPARFADVEPAEGGFFVEQKRVVILFIVKTASARFAGVGTGLNIPFGHENQQPYRALLHYEDDISLAQYIKVAGGTYGHVLRLARALRFT